MYYNTPDTTKMIAFIKRYRFPIILFTFLFSLFSLFWSQPRLVSSDTLFWLSESKQLARNLTKEYRPTYVGQLTVKLDRFDDASKNRLLALQTELENIEGVNTVESLFSSYRIYNDQSSDESALVKALPLSQLEASKIVSFVTAFRDPYRPFVDEKFGRFVFVIHSNAPIRIDTLTIPFSYDYAEPDKQVTPLHLLFYSLVFVLVVMTMSKLIFKNFVAGIGAISVTAITLILTFSLMSLISQTAEIHIAMSLMVISIAFGHYLYFYYRWHVSQFKYDPNRALEKCVNRNLHPALWTIPVLLISLGSLLFADSTIVTMLSLSLMISSVVAYLLSILFLPALLSYFSVSNPKIDIARLCYWFANREIHYSPTLLRKFIVFTFIVLTFVAYRLYHTPALFDPSVEEKTLTLKVPFEEIDLTTLHKIETLENDLRHHHEGVVKIDSIVNVLKEIDIANVPQSPFDEQRLLQALFFLELYDLEKRYIDDDALNITITLKHADPSAIIRFLETYKPLPLYLTDVDTLSQSSKMEKSTLLVSSLATALLIIGIIMGFIFRSVPIALVGLAANAIPVVWFTLFIIVFGVGLGIEALIAMTISVGLSSDTIIHFAYKYFRSRYFGRSRKHSLEIMFFYAGVPAIISAVVLMLVFALLTLTQIPSLQLIGAYGAVLMLISLLSDLFVLPVLLLAVDRYYRLPHTP